MDSLLFDIWTAYKFNRQALRNQAATQSFVYIASSQEATAKVNINIRYLDAGCRLDDYISLLPDVTRRLCPKIMELTATTVVPSRPQQGSLPSIPGADTSL